MQVVIIGAGMAGLTAAHELIQQLSKKSGKDEKPKDNNNATATATTTQNVHITLVESEDRVGGRIRADADLIDDHVIDTGAEFIHGGKTLLTNLIDKYRQKFQQKLEARVGSSDAAANASTPRLLEECFVTAHADGGPSPEPTSDHDKYGMYYLNGQLLMYNDPKLLPLEQALAFSMCPPPPPQQQLQQEKNDNDHDHENGGQHVSPSSISPNVSLGEVLIPKLQKIASSQSLSSSSFGSKPQGHTGEDNDNNDKDKQSHQYFQSLRSLAEASYGNTAGCCDLYQISLSTMMAFEEYWQNNEEEGDYRISSRIGMYEIIQEFYRELLEEVVVVQNNTSYNQQHEDDAAAAAADDKNEGITTTKQEGAEGTTTTTTLTTLFNTKVERIEHDHESTDDGTRIRIICTSLISGNDNNNKNNNTVTLNADYVIVTPPPPIWKNLFSSSSPCPDDHNNQVRLPDNKIECINRLGITKAIKCVMVLNQRFWPPRVQSIVMAKKDRYDDDPTIMIPEIWFREFQMDNKNKNKHLYAAVGFMTSTAAEAFEQHITTTATATATSAAAATVSTTAATDVMIRQLCQVLSIPSSNTVYAAHVETRVYIWEHGYMFPRTMTLGEYQKLCANANTNTNASASANTSANSTTKADSECSYDCYSVQNTLAEPICDDRIHFAGEATNTNACCTVQAAMETGERAARGICMRIGNDH